MDVFETYALLFDMDGTLIDSDQCVRLAWQAWCAQTGADLAEVMRICHGTPSRSTIQQVAPELDLEREIERLEELVRTVEGGQKPVPGAAALLADLAPEKWALVTSAVEQTARFRFEHCHLPYPKVAITAQPWHAGKPAPDPFLAAAQALGVAATACVVFEDSEAGVQGALAAGCRVVVMGDAPRWRPGIIARIRDFCGVSVKGEDRLYVSISGAAHQ